MNIGMVAIHSDKTGIMSQTNIIGIKCEGFVCFKLTDYKWYYNYKWNSGLGINKMSMLQDLACILHEKNTDKS